MREVVKQFIEDNIKLIKNDEWDKFCRAIDVDLTGGESFEVYEILRYSDIDILSYINYIPKTYYFTSTITEFIVPDHIKEIGICSFEKCHQLEKIQLNPNLEFIGRYAFVYCDKLKEIYFPDSLKEISLEAFRDCTSLETISLGKNTYLGINVFGRCPLKSITFRGTIEELIHSEWFRDYRGGFKDKVIHCEDGDYEVGLI